LFLLLEDKELQKREGEREREREREELDLISIIDTRERD